MICQSHKRAGNKWAFVIDSLHDDVIKCKHFPRYWPFMRGIHRSPVNSPHKGQWRGALMFSLICAWTNSWENNGDAGDLRRYRAHYDVIVMSTQWRPIFCWIKWLSHIDGSVQEIRNSSVVAMSYVFLALTHQEKRNSIDNPMELRLSSIIPSIYW